MHKIINKIVLVGILIILAGFNTQNLLAQSIPNFNEGILVLQVNDTYLTNPVISLDGEYVFTTANIIDPNLRSQGYNVYYSMTEADLYVWHIYNSSFTDIAVYPRPNWQLPVEDSVMGPDAAFSPSSEYLALRTDTSLELLAVPELNLVDSASINVPPIMPSDDDVLPVKPPDAPFGYLAWSTDSRLIATLAVGKIIVWDINTYELKEYPTPVGNTYDTIRAGSDGWIVELFAVDSSVSFISCTWLLEVCTPYTPAVDTVSIVTSLDGEIIFTRPATRVENEPYLLRWTRANDGSYVPDEIDVESGLIAPISLNPSNTTLLAINEENSLSFWSFPELNFISAISERIADPLWLPDSHHIVSVKMLTNSNASTEWGLELLIHEVGNETPIAIVNLTEYLSEDYVFHYMEISTDGSKIMLYMGWAVMIIPIEYN